MKWMSAGTRLAKPRIVGMCTRSVTVSVAVGVFAVKAESPVSWIVWLLLFTMVMSAMSISRRSGGGSLLIGDQHVH